MQLERVLSFNEVSNSNYNNYNQKEIGANDISIFNLVDSNNDEQTIDINEVLGNNKTELPEHIMNSIQEILQAQETKKEEDEADKDILSLSEEEIQNMSTEELIDIFRGDLFEMFEDCTPNFSPNMNSVGQNEILFNLVSKMTDEQLDDFMNTYKEKYPSTNNNGTIDLFSFEMLESGVMWGRYAVAAGKLSQEELDDVMSKLKGYFSKLVPDASFGTNGSGYLQWI